MGKIVDMTGRRCGRFTVISYSHSYNGKAFWNCKCDCGTEKVVQGKELRSGGTLSCGCLKRDVIRYEDLTGKSFSHLTVINFDHKDKNHIYWNCKCDCGNNKITTSYALKNGHTKSCGCRTHKGRFKDYADKKFNHLTPLSFDSRDEDKKITYWLCRCDCGKELVLNIKNVKDGHIKDCGCMRAERIKKMAITKTKIAPEHKRLYSILSGMKKRCYNKNCESYLDYGARGISICDEWLQDSESFVQWALSNGYSDSLSIDRIDVNGNYCPENCRWTNWKVQSNNRRSNKIIEYQGESHTVSEWADLIGIKRKVLEQRIRKVEDGKWSLEDAFSKPIKVKNTSVAC